MRLNFNNPLYPGQAVVVWPKSFRALPAGYAVIQLDEGQGHFLWVGPGVNKNGGPVEGVISRNPYWVRRCAFSHFDRSKRPEDYPFIFDEADLEFVKSRNWSITTSGYVRSSTKINGERFLHRILMGATKQQEVDHINRNTLDNRRCNLRLADRKINGFNRKMP